LGATTVTLHIYTENVVRLWQQAVQAGAKILIPLDNQFWGERYGMLKDPLWTPMVHLNADQNDQRRNGSKA
jgi:uncharacterized glyoxalase superfamily protein PhnB